MKIYGEPDETGRAEVLWSGPGKTLCGAHLPYAKLGGANLQNFDLRGANLEGAELTGADFSGAKLDGANLSGARLGGADFTGASCRGTNFKGCPMPAAKFIGTDLTMANLKGADDRYVDWTAARLDGAERNPPKTSDALPDWMLEPEALPPALPDQWLAPVSGMETEETLPNVQPPEPVDDPSHGVERMVAAFRAGCRKGRRA